MCYSVREGIRIPGSKLFVNPKNNDILAMIQKVQKGLDPDPWGRKRASILKHWCEQWSRRSKKVRIRIMMSKTGVIPDPWGRKRALILKHWCEQWSRRSKKVWIRIHEVEKRCYPGSMRSKKGVNPRTGQGVDIYPGGQKKVWIPKQGCGIWILVQQFKEVC